MMWGFWRARTINRALDEGETGRERIDRCTRRSAKAKAYHAQLASLEARLIDEADDWRRARAASPRCWAPRFRRSRRHVAVATLAAAAVVLLAVALALRTSEPPPDERFAADTPEASDVVEVVTAEASERVGGMLTEEARRVVDDTRAAAAFLVRGLPFGVGREGERDDTADGPSDE